MHNIPSAACSSDTFPVSTASGKPCSSLQDGLLFGLPVVFDTHSDKVNVGDKVLLTYQGQNIATLTIDSKWVPNKPVEALKCYGTSSIEHPAVQMISMERGKYYIGVFCFPALVLMLFYQDNQA